MEFLQFIFSSFWVWLGFILLVLADGDVLVDLVEAFRPEKKKEIKKFAVDDGTTVRVVEASDVELIDTLAKRPCEKCGEEDEV
jgi:3-deoxy-D-manno-octulosonate 8-phosphate phosphatase KdsC-like HAD superfamily phosphatase